MFLSREPSVDVPAGDTWTLTGFAWERGPLRPRCNVGSPVRRQVSWKHVVRGSSRRGYKTHIPTPAPTPKINDSLRDARCVVCQNLREYRWILAHNFHEHDVLMVWIEYGYAPKPSKEKAHLVFHTPRHPQADDTPLNSC